VNIELLFTVLAIMQLKLRCETFFISAAIAMRASDRFFNGIIVGFWKSSEFQEIIGVLQLAESDTILVDTEDSIRIILHNELQDFCS